MSATQSCDILSAAREQAQAKAGSGQSACSVEDVLQLLRILFTIGGEPSSGRTLQEGGEHILTSLTSYFFTLVQYVYNNHVFCVEIEELQFNASPEEFTSKKITTKILQQIEVCVLHFQCGWAIPCNVNLKIKHFFSFVIHFCHVHYSPYSS